MTILQNWYCQKGATLQTCLQAIIILITKFHYAIRITLQLYPYPPVYPNFIWLS